MLTTSPTSEWDFWHIGNDEYDKYILLQELQTEFNISITEPVFSIPFNYELLEDIPF